jgi:hypothetical protein
MLMLFENMLRSLKIWHCSRDRLKACMAVYVEMQSTKTRMASSLRILEI